MRIGNKKKILLIVLASVVGAAAVVYIVVQAWISAFIEIIPLALGDKDTFVDEWGHVAITEDGDSTYLIMTLDKNEETVEEKIYKYRYETPYLYTVNKWGRYTVIDTQTPEVVAQTYNLEELPGELRRVFSGYMHDISSIDNVPKDDAIEFGNGTVYLRFSYDLVVLSEKQSGLKYGESSIFRVPILYYKNEGNILYAIGEELSYIIIDTDKYEVLLHEKDTGKMSQKVKAEFMDLNGFTGKRESWVRMNTDGSEYPVDRHYEACVGIGIGTLDISGRVYLIKNFYGGLYICKGEAHDNSGQRLLDGELCFYKVKDGLVYAIGDDLTYLVADIDTGEVIFEEPRVNRLSGDFAQRLGSYEKEFDSLDDFTSKEEALDIIRQQDN